MAVTAGCKGWAVGGYADGYGPYDNTLIEQWNGTAWTVQPSPNPGGSTNPNYLSGVAATSPTNAWAVGSADFQTLTEHWDGTAWSVQPSPNPTPYDMLGGVAATSPTNAWAVGGYLTIYPDYDTLIEHWDGTAWSVQPSPNPGGSNDLSAVAATSPTNAWAVGYYYPDKRGTGSRTLIEHWNGKAWTIQPSPNPGGRSHDNRLYGVAAISATNAWAVGAYERHSKLGTVSRTLIERWNGKVWKVQRSPNRLRSNYLSGVAATSSKNAWAVGTYSPYKRGTLVTRTLIEHWNGTAWKIQSSPNRVRSALYSVAATSPTNAWTVGSYTYNSHNLHIGGPLALHWDGNAWKG